jgi:hypothetical protein
MKLTGSGCTALFSMGLSERDVKELERYRTSVKTADDLRPPTAGIAAIC